MPRDEEERVLHFRDFHDNNAPLLLVEGVDDCHVLRNILRLMQEQDTNFHNSFRMAYCDGRSEVWKILRAELFAETPRSLLGIVIDADQVPASNDIQTLRGKLQQHPSFDIPKKWPNGEGLILHGSTHTGNPRRIGLWRMPDNINEGNLEVLLNRAIPTDTRNFIDETLNTAKTHGHATFKDKDRSKSVLRTHMAWNTPSVPKYGEAISAKLLHHEELLRLCQPFLSWTQELFSA